MSPPLVGAACSVEDAVAKTSNAATASAFHARVLFTIKLLMAYSLTPIFLKVYLFAFTCLHPCGFQAHG